MPRPDTVPVRADEPPAGPAPILLWSSGADPGRTWFNPTWLSFAGRTLDEELGDGWTQRVHPDDLEGLLRVAQAAYEARRPFEMHYRLRRHDGAYRWMKDRGDPLPAAHGGPNGYVGACLDGKLGEPVPPEVADSRDMLSLVMHGGQIGAWSCNLATSTVWMSGELQKLLGRAPEDFDRSEDGVLAMVHDLDRRAVKQAVDAAIGARGEYAVEFRYRHPAGEWRWIEGRGSAQYDPRGRPTMLYGIAMDITPRKRAEHDHAYLAAIVASSYDAVVSKSLDGIISSWNAAAERMFGYSSDEAVGQPITLIIPLEYRDEERRILERLRRGERVEHFETVRRRRDGTTVDVSLTISPVRDSRGTIIGASKIARDISEWKRVQREHEELLIRERGARAEAETASRLKDEFLAILSHELRTPLNAILGWARLLREGHLDAAKAGYAAEVVERNALHQAQLVEDLLDVSGIVTGKLRLEFLPVRPAQVVEAAIEAVRHAAAAKDVLVETVVDADAGPLLADGGRLRQIVGNLLSNAIKFTPPGGRIQVRLAGCDDGGVEIVVSDTGQGIAAEFLSHVFERFRQADATSTRATGGLGLGLAIVQHLVELHGGTVRAESAGEGRGATFTVRLPAMVPASRNAAKPSSSTDRAPRLEPPMDRARVLAHVRVLVVDDEPPARDLVREVLEGSGAEVRSAASANEAMACLEAWRPDLLVSDIAMPGRDGYDLIRRLRAGESRAGARLPAIALTAYARSEDRQKVLSAGYQVHLAKPIDPAELVSAVAELFAASAKS